MSESKWTPGPWHWVDARSDEPIKVVGHLGGSLRTVDEFGENKTEVRDGKSYTSFRLPKFIMDGESFGAATNDENAANARLIAASPDLAEALEKAADTLAMARERLEQSGFMQAAKDCADDESDARAALSRARGETT